MNNEHMTIFDPIFIEMISYKLNCKIYIFLIVFQSNQNQNPSTFLILSYQQQKIHKIESSHNKINNMPNSSSWEQLI